MKKLLLVAVLLASVAGFPSVTVAGWNGTYELATTDAVTVAAVGSKKSLFFCRAADTTTGTTFKVELKTVTGAAHIAWLIATPNIRTAEVNFAADGAMLKGTSTPQPYPCDALGCQVAVPTTGTGTTQCLVK
jgi:hypothetical protein